MILKASIISTQLPVENEWIKFVAAPGAGMNSIIAEKIIIATSTKEISPIADKNY